MNKDELLAGLSRAKQLYMFGDPQENRPAVKSIEELAKETGVKKSVLVTHVGIWSTELLATAQACHRNFSSANDPKVIEDNDDDINFIREELDSLKVEIRKLTDKKSSIRIALMQQFHTLSERWRKLTQVTAAMEVAAKTVEYAAEAAIKGTIRPNTSEGKGKRPSSAIFDANVTVEEATQQGNTNP